MDSVLGDINIPDSAAVATVSDTEMADITPRAVQKQEKQKKDKKEKKEKKEKKRKHGEVNGEPERKKKKKGKEE